MLSQDLRPVQGICDMLLPEYMEILSSSRKMKSLSWEGPLGVYSEEALVPALTISPDGDDDEDTQNTSPMKDVLRGREPVIDDEALGFQLLPEIKFFTTMVFIIYPELIQTPKILEEIENTLSSTVCIAIAGEEVFHPHGIYEQVIASVKSKYLVLDKTMPIRCLDVALSQGPYTASIRRAMIVATGNALFDFLCEDTKVYVPLCIENAVGLLGLCAAEIEFYLAHVYHTVTLAKKNTKLNGTEFEDAASFSRLVDLFVRFHDLLMMHTEDVTSAYRYFLTSRDTRALRYALSEVRKVMEPAYLPILTRCQELISQAEQPDKIALTSDSQALHSGPSHYSMLMTVRLELLRLSFQLTQTSVRQPAAMGILWQSLNRTHRRLIFADPTLYASYLHQASEGCGSAIFAGNMPRVMRTILSYIESPDLQMPVLTTLLRIPSLLAQLSSPLHSMIENNLHNEAVYMWTKIFVFFFIRKVEVLLTDFILQRAEHEQSMSMMATVGELSLRPAADSTDKKDSGPGGIEPVGADTVFVRRGKMEKMAHTQQVIYTILSSLYSLTGKPTRPPIVYGLPMTKEDADAPEKHSFPPLFSFMVVQNLSPDGIIYIGPNTINVTGILSVMVTRLLSRLFAHVCTQPLTKFSAKATTDLLDRVTREIQPYPYVPAYSLYTLNALDLMQNRLKLTFTNYLRGDPASTQSSPLNATPHIRDGSVMSHLDYESEPVNEWWTPPVSVSLQTILTATTPDHTLSDRTTPPATVKDSEVPQPPSIVFSHINSIVNTSKLALHLGYPLLQIDEIAQRVLLNMCIVPPALPEGFAISPALPLGAWFYRVFGRENQDSVDGTENGHDSVNTAFENDGPTTGYITMVYARWYSDVFCSSMMASAEPPVIYSPQECGFIRPPSTQYNTSPQIVRQQQTVFGLTSSYELQTLAELVGPFGVEAISTMIERCAIPRHLARIVLYINQQFSSVQPIKETKLHQLPALLDTIIKSQKGKEIVDFAQPLMAIGSSVYFVEILRKTIEQQFGTHQRQTADTLRSITSMVTQIMPRSTLKDVNRLYALTPAHADGQPPLFGVNAQATGAELYDAPFFTYIGKPAVDYGKFERVSHLPSLALIFLHSPTIWTQSIYLTSVGGFDTNLHTAARGLVYVLHAFGTPPPLPIERESTLEIAVRRLLAPGPSEHPTPQSLIFNLLDTACSLVVDSSWDEDHRQSLEHKVMFLSYIFAEAPWIGNETFEHWLPNDLIKSVKLTLMRTG